VNHERRSVVIEKINHFNNPTTSAASDDEPFLLVALSREAATGIPHDRFDLGDGAAVLGGVGLVPVDRGTVVAPQINYIGNAGGVNPCRAG
jgi:hypothetical protein